MGNDLSCKHCMWGDTAFSNIQRFVSSNLQRSIGHTMNQPYDNVLHFMHAGFELLEKGQVVGVLAEQERSSS